jgi:phospholipid/cholesterol/gamma-HCH transport system ATP-binding protein
MIEVRALSKRFGSHVVLREVSLQIPQGQTTYIIGRSGSGKTVLLKHIVGLLRPDSGSILIDGAGGNALHASAVVCAPAPLRVRLPRGGAV